MRNGQRCALIFLALMIAGTCYLSLIVWIFTALKAGSFQWVMLGGYIISKFMLAILGDTK